MRCVFHTLHLFTCLTTWSSYKCTIHLMPYILHIMVCSVVCKWLWMLNIYSTSLSHVSWMLCVLGFFISCYIFSRSYLYVSNIACVVALSLSEWNHVHECSQESFNLFWQCRKLTMAKTTVKGTFCYVLNKLLNFSKFIWGHAFCYTRKVLFMLYFSHFIRDHVTLYSL